MPSGAASVCFLGLQCWARGPERVCLQISDMSHTPPRLWDSHPPVPWLSPAHLPLGHAIHNLLPSPLAGSVALSAWSSSCPPGRALRHPGSARVPLLWGVSLSVMFLSQQRCHWEPTYADTAASLTRLGACGGWGPLLFISSPSMSRTQNRADTKEAVDM